MRKYSFELGMPERITVVTADDRMTLPVRDGRAMAGDLSVELADGSVCLTAQDTAVKTIILEWPVGWGEDDLFLGDAWERSYGDLGWRKLDPGRVMPWYFAVGRGEETFCVGVKVRPSAICSWRADAERTELTMDVRCGGEGVWLNGRRLQAAELLTVRMGECSRFEALCSFCGSLCDDPLLADFPVYGGNNWYYAYGDSSEEAILKDCDCIAELTEGLKNRPFMVIDDGWQQNHRIGDYNGGPWYMGNEKFPDMERLAARMKEKGVRPGLWTRLLQNEDRELPKEWRLSHNGCLDPSHPEALAYIREDVLRFGRWGYRLLKHDFSTCDIFGGWGFEMDGQMTRDGWHFYDRTRTSAEIVKDFYRTILEACRENDVLVLGCNTIGHLGAGYMHVSRIGDDTSGTDWGRTRRMGINTLAFRLPQNGTFYAVDADCAGYTGKIEWKYNRQWTQLLAESGSPLFVSIKPGILTEEEKMELSGLMETASQQEWHLEPLDWMENDWPGDWEEKDQKLERHFEWE